MYVAKEQNEIVYGPNVGKGVKVGIFRVENEKEEQIGEFDRNYPTLFNAFFPFHLNGADLALYSPDYTVTRIMSLPSCKDLGGEEPDSMGFCPVDYFVPSFIIQEQVSNSVGSGGRVNTTKQTRRIYEPAEAELEDRSISYPGMDLVLGEETEITTSYKVVTPLTYSPFGFVAGCIWGDDSSWKIQYLDLSQADSGIVKRDERFGYIALPRKTSLREAIDMYCFGYDDASEYSHYIRIAAVQTYDTRSGKLVDPFA